MKICVLGIELFHADGQIDMTELIVTLRNFVNVPKTELLSLSTLCLQRQVLENSK
jgi:hypothetical protein